MFPSFFIGYIFSLEKNQYLTQAKKSKKILFFRKKFLFPKIRQKIKHKKNYKC